jgi:hypothetical protein
MLGGYPDELEIATGLAGLVRAEGCLLGQS